MRLRDIGEVALIERLAREFGLPASAPGLAVGIGDDTAAVDTGCGDLVLVTTDMLSEGMDYLPDKITPYRLGWKSVAANISDIAAMGGEPTWTFVSIGFRPDTEVAFVEELYRGMVECARRFGSTVAGGDTNSVRGDGTVSITQLGRVERDRIVTRSGARVGDRLLVTGRLGDSRGGLELLLRFGLEEAERTSKSLIDAHLSPMPRVPEARAAASTGLVRAMMDLSDGLGSDLPKLCRASGVGAVVRASLLPIGDDLLRISEMLGLDALELAAGGGEEFELLMVVDAEGVDTVIGAIETTGTPVTEIGEITRDRVEIELAGGGVKPLSGGWEHFH